MCGIVGYSGAQFSNCLPAMMAAIAHRGPDGNSVWCDTDEAIGLGHARLSILDLSNAAAQPMHSPDGRYVLSYNGEIYNFRELRAGLEARGHRFVSTGDTEVLLAGLAEYGFDFLKRLNGIFAFALWDRREHELFLARDQLGIKPLYYAQLNSAFLFASELKALLMCPAVPRNIDLVAINQYLSYLWCPAPRTALAKVQKLEPGTALLIKNGRLTKSWYFYDLPYGQPPLMQSEDEIALELAARVEDAVRRQMVSDVPIGAFLSGGLDSSAVVAMMRKVSPGEPFPCYSIGFAGDENVDGHTADMPFARMVADHLGIDLRPIEVKSDIIRHFARMLFHLDEPQADPAPINALLICERARADGLKVLMSGAGGDDIFSGYRRHAALDAEKFWSWLPQVARDQLADLIRCASAGSVLGIDMRRPLARQVTKALSFANLNGDERLASYFLWGQEETRRSLYSPEAAAELASTKTLQPLLASLSRIPNESDPLNRMLYLETKHFLADHNLNYTDKVGMAVGVEVRVPLIDVDLVDYAARIPVRMKQNGKMGKAIFKRSMERYLPQNVIYRPKTGFGAPLRKWLHAELRPMIDDFLSPDTIRKRGIFAPAAVSRLIALDRAGRIDAGYTIFSLLSIEMWCQMFVDHAVPRPIS